MPHLDLLDDEAALIKELHDTVHSDRYPFSERVSPLKAILAKLRLEPVPRALAAPEGVCAAVERQIRGTPLGEVENRFPRMTHNPVIYAHDALDRAEEFFEAFPRLPPLPWGRWIS